MTDNAFEDIGDEPRPPRPKGPVKRVRPRDAATLILINSNGPAPTVLMGRRHGGHNFMPGKWVFPGGRIDRSDFSAPAHSELAPHVADRVGKTAPAPRARALAMAAVRETYEECGLLLAKPAPVRDAPGPWKEFLGHGAMADLEALSFVARAITPPSSPKRFDARFFMATADRLISMDRQPDCGELDEIAWVALDEALNLDLPSVTRFVLKEIPLRLADPARPVPFLRFMWSAPRTSYL